MQHLVSGRVRELGALQAERHRSARGELRVALVLGEAGLGKTRLAAELLARDGESAVGLIAHNSPFAGMPPFGPWADALGLHAGDRELMGSAAPAGAGSVAFRRSGAAPTGTTRPRALKRFAITSSNGSRVCSPRRVLTGRSS